ncbi:uncharacterized protein BDW43DRAFT_271611 [Aspergillus alliaceus]|uniref:uncharacterized protein n=1 Tax=Petromyces alliaceus TaxID=209559 RepID=UPI0012A547C9|nr:uncharacterized protein BDW43DRAFT_271611 [Aspergillus alliaceus]KAB8234841.1 hypothetical protein BDW43DRAFT_271611 [Aspergillus alliaceus]
MLHQPKARARGASVDNRTIQDPTKRCAGSRELLDRLKGGSKHMQDALIDFFFFLPFRFFSFLFFFSFLLPNNASDQSVSIQTH